MKLEIKKSLFFDRWREAGRHAGQAPGRDQLRQHLLRHQASDRQEVWGGRSQKRHVSIKLLFRDNAMNSKLSLDTSSY
jgi:hypothetical protein